MSNKINMDIGKVFALDHKILIIIIFFILNISNVGYTQFNNVYNPFGNLVPCAATIVIPNQDFNICISEPWLLVFEDNFDGNELNKSVWYTWYGVPRDLSFDQQKAWHLPENVVVNNGVMEIWAKEDLHEQMPVTHSYEPPIVKYEDFEYTTGEVWTEREFGYGKFQASIKLPAGDGLFPAFWLFSGSPYNEIDILEFFGDEPLPMKHQMDVHFEYNNSVGNCGTSVNNGTDFSASYHLFELVWGPDKIEWCVDGNLRRREFKYYDITGAETGCQIKGFHQYVMNVNYPNKAMSIILNLAIRSNNFAPDGSGSFPVKMEVDWVKYFKHGACKSVSHMNLEEFDFHQTEFNSIAGLTVELGGSFSVNWGQQLDVIAENSITLSSGFSVEPGADFLAKIVNPLCSSTENKNNSLSDENEVVLESNNHLFTVILFPNPAKDVLHVSINCVSCKSYSAFITSIDGKLIKSISSINEPEFEINLLGIPSGVYQLNVVNRMSKVNDVHTFIIE